tara:strand:- start:302 stop:1024 length:723 start_codon:yes stop_codon:yes gene_type:complete
MDRTRALSILGFEEEPDTLALKNAYRERSMRLDLGDNTSGEHGEIRAAYRTLLVSPRDVSTLIKDARAERLTVPPSVIIGLELTLQESLRGGLYPVLVNRWVEPNGYREHESETIYVDVKPGVDNGEIIILPGLGNQRTDGVNSDVKIFIKLHPHTDAIRCGLNVEYTRNLDLREAYTQKQFELKHIDGKIYTLEVPELPVQPGTEMRVPGKGFTRNGHAGDMIVRFNIVLPKVPPFVDS